MCTSSQLFLFLCASILNFICLSITQSSNLTMLFCNSSHLAHPCVTAILYNAFRGLRYLTIYTFFQITVNIWDNKGAKGPGIITYCENWLLNPNLCFLILTNHLSMLESPLLFLRVLVLNPFWKHNLLLSSCQAPEDNRSFNWNNKGYIFPQIWF